MNIGKNPIMRAFGHTYGVPINRLYELFDDDLNDRIQEEGDQTPMVDLESPLIQREVSEQSSDFEATQTGRKM